MTSTREEWLDGMSPGACDSFISIGTYLRTVGCSLPASSLGELAIRLVDGTGLTEKIYQRCSVERGIVTRDMVTPYGAYPAPIMHLQSS